MSIISQSGIKAWNEKTSEMIRCFDIDEAEEKQLNELYLPLTEDEASKMIEEYTKDI